MKKARSSTVKQNGKNSKHSSRNKKNAPAKNPRKVSVKKTNSKITEGRKSFPIVGIGGSAGGLEAFSTFLQHLPSGLGMAYVYIQHLSPSHESFLPQIL